MKKPEDFPAHRFPNEARSFLGKILMMFEKKGKKQKEVNANRTRNGIPHARQVPMTVKFPWS